MSAAPPSPKIDINEVLKKIRELVTNELRIVWAAHHNVGLDGYMCLYTNTEQVPFRTKEAGLTFWFGPQDSQAAVDEILSHYNNGRLPNSPMLLNPIVHRKEADGSYTPLGSGLVWCNALSLGVNVLNNLPNERITSLGAFVSSFTRGINTRAGIKVIGFCDSIQSPEPDGRTVACCIKLYDIADIASEKYATSYFLSGIGYLTNNGLFEQQNIMSSFPENTEINEDFIKKHTISSQDIFDAAKCWEAYDRIHSLYIKFGINPENIERNLRFFNLVARDITLFDATGPSKSHSTSTSKKSSFDFIVPGILPRASVSMLIAPGGSGRSSSTHHLSVLASTDYEDGVEPPKWLGQPLNIDQCQGIIIYFSGEDGPQVFNARASAIDPESKALRLMFQRTDFGENVTFAQHLRNLQKIPDVPLIIVDPSRKYLGGDENDNNIVSNFFDALEDFAIQKNTAILVVHHLNRGSNPKTAKEMLDMMGGGQPFIDRPRVIIGMFNEGNYTIAGLVKNNIPPNLGMITGERVFARDAKHLSLVWLEGKDGIRNAPLSEEEINTISHKAG